jgi:hypothetical protein
MWLVRDLAQSLPMMGRQDDRRKEFACCLGRTPQDRKLKQFHLLVVGGEHRVG